MVAAIVLCLAAIVACSGGGGDDEAASDESPPSVTNASSNDADQIDDRFTSPRALMDHVRLLCQALPADVEGFLALVHAENDVQRDWLIVLRNETIPRLTLHNRMIQLFGEGLDGVRELRSPWITHDMHVVEEDERRATVRCTSTRGQECTLHLVNTLDRWWISGYTFEHHPDNFGKVAAERAAQTQGLRLFLDRLLKRLNAGEFNSAAEADGAYQRTRTRHAESPGLDRR